MGAEWVMESRIAFSPQEAFDACVGQAVYLYGHSGYTGSMAEKSSFVMLEVPEGVDPHLFAGWVEHETEPVDLQLEVRNAVDVVSDKWGPAGCIKCGENKFLFIGWASS